ncbi:alpha/beta fold hydrolase [Undibacter mobilis]|uniref:Alpha/beta fold hydrolase n=2 Tax=Undibacter mobilis TaxID=2292256 RepID=A0A371BDZ6_9BRAD|nr:alpha/beta fold hydrolase [Undibacter mobilis]
MEADAAAVQPAPFQHPVPVVMPVAQPPSAPQTARPLPTDFEPADAPDRRDAYAVTALGDVIDRAQHAAVARLTMGLSPTALMQAYMDWAIHLASQPGKRLQLIDKAMRKSTRLAQYATSGALKGEPCDPCIKPLPQDHRFDGADWQKWPFNVMSQAFLLNQQWWHNATTGLRGVSKQHEKMVEFASRQVLDMFAPSNFPFTNPEVMRKTLETGGQNLAAGFQNFLQDWERKQSGKKPVGTENFVVGRDVAVTPGKVVYRNRLIELIQYAPATAEVRPEPILIVPAWIMKYYILDLSPHNSMVKYLTSQGFTVYMISWKNPDADDRDLSMEDYRTLGVMAALDRIGEIEPERKVHAVGYCLGGTLLSIAAAAMARDHDERLQTVTLLAAQTDFTEAGEMMLFINESQLAFLDDMMWEQGFLDTTQMAGAFQMLRSNDLVWSYLTRNYLMGEREPMNDLMAWNADATRMPYRMHSEYLHKLFLNNELAEGRYMVGDRPVALTDIRVPIFAVGTERDHVAPWRSTFKIHRLTETEVTYLLTTGGHNAGIVSEPNHRRRSYRVTTTAGDALHVDADTWAATVSHKEGSWWPEWSGWLSNRSGGWVAPPGLVGGYGAFADAPGRYVLAP